MIASGIMLLLGGIGMLMASVAIRMNKKPAHPYGRTAYALAPVQAIMGLVAMGFGSVYLVG